MLTIPSLYKLLTQDASIQQCLGKLNLLSLERKTQKVFNSHTREIPPAPTESVEVLPSAFPLVGFYTF